MSNGGVVEWGLSGIFCAAASSGSGLEFYLFSWFGGFIYAGTVTVAGFYLIGERSE